MRPNTTGSVAGDPAPHRLRHGTVAATIGGAIYLPGGAVRQGFGASAVNEVFVPPSGVPLVVTRARQSGARLRIRGRIEEPHVAAASLQWKKLPASLTKE